MPKADATGLASKKSARHAPRLLIGAGGLLCSHSWRPFLWWSLGADALGTHTRRSPEGRSKFFALFAAYKNENLAGE